MLFLTVLMMMESILVKNTNTAYGATAYKKSCNWGKRIIMILTEKKIA